MRPQLLQCHLDLFRLKANFSFVLFGSLSVTYLHFEGDWFDSTVSR